MDSLIAVVIISALILLNGLFVAAEFAIIGAPRAAIERRAARGEKLAQLVRQILRDPRRQDQYIATAQLGITLASLGLGMYGEHILAEWIAHALAALGTPGWLAAHALASVLAVAILTYFHIVVGEMVPKSLALQQAERTALWVTRPMLWIKYAFYPLVIALNGIGNGLLRLLGIDRRTATGHQFHSAEELQYVIEESQKGGLLRRGVAQFLREIFEFGDLTVGEVMVPRVMITGLPVGAQPAEVAAALRASGHTRYPVYDRDLDHIIGVIHIKDLLKRLGDGRPLAAADARPVPRVPETSLLDTALGVMRRERAQMVVVMDEHGGTAGLVTIEDLFEEVVGEIEEGAVAPDAPIYRDPAGRLRVFGTVRLDEVGEHLDIALEHEEVATVSGLILMLLERPARVGDKVEFAGAQFEVTAVAGHGVKECLVRYGAGRAAAAPEV